MIVIICILFTLDLKYVITQLLVKISRLRQLPMALVEENAILFDLDSRFLNHLLTATVAPSRRRKNDSP